MMEKPNYLEINRLESSLWYCLTHSGYESYTEPYKEAHDKGRRMSLERSRRLEIVNIILFVWGAITGAAVLWPYHRAAFIWTCAILAVVLLWAWIGIRIITFVCFGVIVLVAVTTISLPPPLPTSELQMESYLTPGNDPSPPNPCGSAISADSFVVYAGTNAGVMQPGVTEYFPLIVNEMPLITIKRVAKGIAISAKVFNQQGIVVEIEDNKATRNPSNSYKMEPTEHSLVIKDNSDQVVSDSELSKCTRI